MRLLSLLFLGFIFFSSCTSEPKISSHNFSQVSIDVIYEDSVSIRAIEFMNDGSLAFAGSNGIYGLVDTVNDMVKTNVQRQDSLVPEFRAIGHTATDFFMLSVATPALLYKTGISGQMELVYQEDGEGVFYDALAFWNDKEGLAIGDAIDGCLSILITRDGGKQWKKIECDDLPEAKVGEGAFAASNTNIEIQGNNAWIATTSGTLLFSSDKGKNWRYIQTPMRNEAATEGIYSIDFYDADMGFAIGGDFTKPDNTHANKAITIDGGVTWNLVADNVAPGYKSCVQYVPNAGGKDLVVIGFTGISYSNDAGLSWKELSKESFYTIRFMNDSVAYAAGKNRIAKLTLKK